MLRPPPAGLAQLAPGGLDALRVPDQFDARRGQDADRRAQHPVAVGATGMEYGGITPIGLPADWPLLLDAAVTALPHVLVGSGRRRGKLILPGKALLQLPGAVVLDGLGR